MQLPSQVDHVPEAGVQALPQEGRRLVGRIPGQEDPPLAPALGVGGERDRSSPTLSRDEMADVDTVHLGAYTSFMHYRRGEAWTARGRKPRRGTTTRPEGRDERDAAAAAARGD